MALENPGHLHKKLGLCSRFVGWAYKMESAKSEGWVDLTLLL
jgi:hypothetical protein